MKTRNKKRLITLVLVFALVFLTGAAFALTAGVLDIVGAVNISAPDGLYVIWHDVTETAQQNVIEHTASIVDRRGPVTGGTPPVTLDREDQRIVWNITFDGQDAGTPTSDFAYAEITAMASNESNVNAMIASARVNWVNLEGIPDAVGTVAPDLNPALFGLSYVITPGDFVGPLAGETVSAPLIVRVVWDGRYPPGFFGDADAGTPVFAGTLVIEFDYTPAT